MNVSRPALPAVLASVLCAGAVALPAAQQAAEGIPVPFSDPARVGSVSVRVHDGAITIRGETRKDVLVTSQSPSGDARNRRTADVPQGFRVLTSGSGVNISEENNQMQINAASTGATRLDIRVPTRVNLTLSGHNGAGIDVENVEGDIEARHHNASIRLTNVAGSVVANTHNGDIRVVLTRITGDKAMAFTSFNGTVDVTLPASAKANLRMRSDRGDIITDFDVQVRPGTAPQTRSDGRTRVIEINQSVFGAINGGGPEFELRTFNGDIFVRRSAQP
jgi:DUF4097 and DUF4098 domain-containing protein YvlB